MSLVYNDYSQYIKVRAKKVNWRNKSSIHASQYKMFLDRKIF